MPNQPEELAKGGSSEKETTMCSRHSCSKIDHPIPFLVTACLHFLILIAAASYFGGVVSTLEKQFQLDSRTSGVIAIVSDVSSFSVVLFITYYGSKSNQPRIIGIGAVVSSIGYFCCALPHFLNDPYRHQDLSTSTQETSDKLLCNGTVDNSSSSEIGLHSLESAGQSKDTAGIGWLVTGNLLIGFGSSPLFPLTLTYLDDSTIDPSTTSIYIAAFLSMMSVGPLLGFFTSFKCLSLYVDFYRVNEEDIPEGFRDPSWLGAWWLGYLFASVAILILSIPMFFFPRHLTKYECQICNRRGEHDDKGGKHMIGVSFRIFDNASGAFEIIVGFLKVLRRLLVNPVLVSVFLVTSCDLAIIGGFLFFVAKYIQVQFGVSPATASLIVGLTTAPGNIIGNVISSFIVKKLKVTLRGLSIMLVIMCMSAALLSIPVIFIGCSNPQIAGVTVPYWKNNTLKLPAEFETCNMDCSCLNGVYEPVCGADGVTYLSPCHAGCIVHDDVTQNNGTHSDKMKFFECSCIDESSQDIDFNPIASEGVCHFVCDKTVAFSVLIAVISLFASMRSNPALMTVLRCVDDEDRGLAMGYESLIVRALGLFPASAYFGAVISSTCLFRQDSETGGGACLIYDLQNYRYSFIGLFLGLKCLGATFACCVFLSVKYWKIPRDKRTRNQKQIQDESPTVDSIDIVKTVV